jgi:Rod binding domain-containing protein
MNTALSAQLGTSLASVGDAANAQAISALKYQAKAKAAAQNFEAVFLNSMFQNMFTAIKGEGPFGGSGALKIWRSMLTDEYAKSFAKHGGIGIASHVYDELIKLQSGRSAHDASKAGTTGAATGASGTTASGAAASGASSVAPAQAVPTTDQTSDGDQQS